MDEGDSGFVKFKQTSDDVISLAPSTADSIFLEGMELLCFSGVLCNFSHGFESSIELSFLLVVTDGKQGYGEKQFNNN